MGVNLRGLVPIENVKLEDLSGKTIAIDAYNALVPVSGHHTSARRNTVKG